MKPTVDIALAVIFRDGRVLVARRPEGPLADHWEFPGGKVEAGESVESAARRECLEELGVDFEVQCRLETVEHAWPDAVVRLHPLVGRLGAGGEPAPLASHGLAWAEPEELAFWRIPEPNHAILAQLALLSPQRPDDAPA